MFGARKELATNKMLADGDEGFCLVMADASDQAKTGSPHIRQGGRAGGRVKKIKQQFIGVIVHGRGYYLYRRLPVTPKGANLTATLLIDLFEKGLLRKAHTLVVQWDGKSHTHRTFRLIYNNYTCTMHHVELMYAPCMHELCTHAHVGASENVAKTNWRLCVWLLMRMTGLRKIILCRLVVGHTHFVVDQRHSVFARFLRGIRGLPGSCRKDFHSLTQFVEAAHRVAMTL